MLYEVITRALTLAVVGLGLALWEVAADAKLINTFYTSRPRNNFV